MLQLRLVAVFLTTARSPAGVPLVSFADRGVMHAVLTLVGPPPPLVISHLPHFMRSTYSAAGDATKMATASDLCD